MIGEMLADFLDFYIKILAISLGVRWLFSLLPETIYSLFRAIGLIFRFPIKRFFYWAYGVPVHSIDWSKGAMETDEIKNLDCLITTNITLPFVAMTYVSGWLLYYGNAIYYSSNKWIGGFIWFAGVAIVCFSPPDIEELKKLAEVSLGSIILYFVKLLGIVGITYSIYAFTGLNKDLFALIVILLLAIPIYHYSESDIVPEIEGKTSGKAIILEGDPFA